MAKLNYQRLQRESYQQTRREQDFRGNMSAVVYYDNLESGLWTVGKYRGTPVKQLPLTYLFWVLDNLNGLQHAIAEAEVRRRNAELDT